MAESFASFEAAYCPPIDPALLSAILSDYNLSSETDVTAARATLDSVKLSAVDEDESGFDASGSSSKAPWNARSPSQIGSDLTDSSPDTGITASDDTAKSKISDDIRSLGLGSENTAENEIIPISVDDVEYIEQLDFETKKLLLKEMFPALSELTITLTLKKPNVHWNTILENLLNESYFEDSTYDHEYQAPTKGIDGFAEGVTPKRGRQRRGKDNKKYYSSINSSPASSAPGTPPNGLSNAWNIGKSDIFFISEHTKLSSQVVSSAYHRNGASVGAAILDLLDSFSQKAQAVVGEAEAKVIETNVSELGKEFPTINLKHCIALIRLTHPSSASAHKLAQAIVSTSGSSSRNNKSGIELITNYAPIDLPSDGAPEGGWTTPRTRSTARLASTSSSSSRIDPAALATSYSLAHNSAVYQARATYSRGKSSGDRLMSAAAGYYSQLSRDLAVKRDAASSEAADAIVAAQSTGPGMVDLHGVNVKDGVRIAREKLDAWHAGGGKGVLGLDGRRGEGSGGQGFKIVVGVGKHSVGGMPKVGPAVRKMLREEGWKAEEGHGVFTVTGRKR